MIRIVLVIICWACAPFLEGTTINVQVQAESAILMNADTGAILYEKNAHKRQLPASITKIATVLYALHVRGDKLDKMITAERDCLATISEEELKRSNYSLPAHWLIPGATHIGIKNGEILSLKDLLYGTMLVSGGDSSNVIAHYIGGTVPKFMLLVNEYLKSIGCKDTHFKNPHGIHHPHQYTTAYDMALLTREGLKNPSFREIVKTTRYQRPQTNKQKPSTFVQSNKLLVRGKHYYPKAIGVKTGYYSTAQSTLVAAAKDGDRTLIAVLMKCKERDTIFQDTIKLFEAAFQEKKLSRKLLPAGKQNALLKLPRASKAIATFTKSDVTMDYYPSEEPQIKCSLLWDEVALPVRKDDYLGALCFQDQQGKVLFTEPLFALQDVHEKWSYRAKAFLAENKWIKTTAIFTALLLFGGLLLLLSRRKTTQT